MTVVHEKDGDAEKGNQEEVRRCSKGCFPTPGPPWKRNNKGAIAGEFGPCAEPKGGEDPARIWGVTGFGTSSKRDAVLGHLVLPNGRLHVGALAIDSWVKSTHYPDGLHNAVLSTNGRPARVDRKLDRGHRKRGYIA